MSNFNKVVTNLQQSLSNAENDNLSQTLSAVRTAGGGGGGGTSYGGDGIYIEIVGNNTITLTTTAAEKLNRAIPTKVTELTDSADYATTAYVNGVTGSIYYTSILGLSDALSAKQDKLTFGYDENDAISSINSHKLAGANGITGDYYSASNPSGFINSAQAETQILAKNYITSGVSQLDNFYSKTDTSSKTELQTKFNSLLDYNVTAAAGIEVTTATDVGIKTFGISMTAQPVVTDTRLSGYNGIAAEPDGSVTGLWDVGLTQDMLNTINGKIDTTAAAQTYQPKGDYLSANALEGYATTALLDTISSKIENDIPTTVAQLTDSGNYYKKSETSGATELSTALGNKVDKPVSLNNKYLVLRTNGDGSVSGWVDFNDNVYSKTEADGRYQKILDMGNYLTTAKYATDSATFYPTSNPDGYLTKTVADTYYQPTGYYATSAGLTAGNQYAMTTTGWSVVQGGTSFTGVVTGTGLSGTGLSNSPLGIDTNASIYLSNGSAKSAISAESATNALSSRNSKQLQDASKIIEIKDVTALQNWASSNSSTWDSVSAKLGTTQYALDSATFVTSSSNTITGTKQYALTTTGWSDIGLSAYLPLTGGTISGDVIVKSTGKNLLAVNTTATLMGQSRVANLTDTTAIGTNWLGVNSLGGGFLKNVQGGNVGDLNGTSSIQINFASDGANSYGNITVNSQDNVSKVVHVPTASYNSMSSFDNTNGPNYMLRKTASGFDIGAAVINVTQLPAQTEANTYYFIYDT